MVNFNRSLSVNHLVLTLGLAFLFRLAFRLGLGWLYVSLRRVRRTLYDLYFTYFLPEVIMKSTRKARGHYVRLILTGMHMIECIFLRRNILYACQYHFVYMFHMFIDVCNIISLTLVLSFCSEAFWRSSKNGGQRKCHLHDNSAVRVCHRMRLQCKHCKNFGQHLG